MKFQNLALCLVAFALVLADADAAPKPDIVLIVADDLGTADVGWRGGEIKTPNLDKLAMAGARLEQFYVQPVCSPTRAALMTGRYPMRYGFQVGVVRPWAEYGLPLEEQMLPEGLRDAGYTTAIVGKWHLGAVDKAYWPNQRGFDHWYGHLQGALDYFTHIREDKLDWFRNGEPNHDEGYSTHLLAREAVQIIEKQSRTKPLFLYVPFNAVHGPYQVTDKYKAPYKHLPEQRRTYAGMIAAMDEAVGQIVEAVEKSGRRKNTLFIFSSDNGGPAPDKITSNQPYRSGKHTVYEGGVRVAAFATWDKKIKPQKIEAPMHMVDLYPTLLNLAGASPKQKLPIDGKDIWPCLVKNKPSPHEEILLNASPNGGAIRVGDWKYLINGELPAKKAKTDLIELFNLAKDPGEKENLAALQPARLKELQARYESLARQAVAPLSNGD